MRESLTPIEEAIAAAQAEVPRSNYYTEPFSEPLRRFIADSIGVPERMEELEAVDWYNQRVDACKNTELKAILAHNRDEEKEHAAMLLEWIRRKDSSFEKELKDYLFTDKAVAHE